MKRIIELVNLSFMNSHEYFEKSIDITHNIILILATLLKLTKMIVNRLK